jgi:NAD(P)-dependent dehydrogenase (short-subunit alcohol dehydrogenase family)
MNLHDTVVLVAGGGSGLGLATAQACRERGADVLILDLPAAADRVAAEGFGFHPADVRDPEAVAAGVDRATSRGPLRAVVNCAGIGPAARVLRKGVPMELSAFRDVVEVNLIGTFNVLRLGAAAMAANEMDGDSRGVIVNTASVAAFDGQIGQAAYSASKGGIAAMTLPIARDLATSGIRCVTIAPGLFDTPLLATLPDDARAALAASVPHPSRLGRPDEYAQLVTHVLENEMLNGEVIRLDGAIRMAPR